jgi:hypothetical protein
MSEKSNSADQIVIDTGLVPPEGTNFKKPKVLRATGSTGKSRHFISELHDAIRRVETRRNRRLVDHLVEMAFEDKQVLLAVARKILPDLKHVEAHAQTDTEITIKWDTEGNSGIHHPLPSTNKALTAGDGDKLALPPSDADDSHLISTEPTVSRNSATITKEILRKELLQAEDDGKLTSLKAAVTEVMDDSDDDYEGDGQ